MPFIDDEECREQVWWAKARFWTQIIFSVVLLYFVYQYVVLNIRLKNISTTQQQQVQKD